MSQRMMLTGLGALFAHTTVVLVLLTVGYYLLPVRALAQPEIIARLGGGVVALALVSLVLRTALRRSRRAMSPALYRAQWLLMALYLLILGFALAYAVVAGWTEGQIVGISNRTDALYFSVTVTSTLGFGDVHASGTVARVIVTVHMLINLLYLGTALRLLSSIPEDDGAQSRPPER
jgi:voltage-gated potassium channel